MPFKANSRKMVSVCSLIELQTQIKLKETTDLVSPMRALTMEKLGIRRLKMGQLNLNNSINIFTKKFLYFVIALTLSQESFAISYKNYKENLNSDEMAKTVALVFIHGVGDGFMFANAELESKKIAPIFCPPGKLAITPEQYIKFLDEAANNLGASANDFPVPALLLSRLKTVFPCN